MEIAPRRPGRYRLVDSMRLYNEAAVFVVPYATIDVTGTDGKFEIKGIPVGTVKVDALLPQTMARGHEEVMVKENEVTEVNFELKFDQEAYDATDKPTPLDELPAPE